MTSTSSALVARARARRSRDLRRARRDPAAFIEYALRHERDNTKLDNAAFHVEWQRFLDAHRWAVLIAPVEHAKTQQISVGRLLWLIGTDPERRCAVVSDTADQAEKVLRAIKTHIEENPRVREVFPDLRRSENPADPWHSSAITVQRRTTAKDPTLQVCGAFGSINGARLDVVILDDVCDFENTRTAEQRKKLIDWIDTTLVQRATDGSVFVAVGTPWDTEDALHQLAERPGFGYRRYSAVRNPEATPARWEPLWPEQWSRERLIERQQNTSKHAFDRKLLTVVRRDATARFQSVWLQGALAAGRGMTMQRKAPIGRNGFAPLACFTGVDLGVGDSEHDARTVVFTIAIDERGRRIVCEVESGRWTSPEIVERLADTYARFGSKVAVEDNAAQRFLVQFARERFPVIGMTTGGYNKHHEEFGVESLAVEMRQGLWVVPSGDSGRPQTEAVSMWLREMLEYDPSAHTGDHVMASWIAREVARKHGAPMLGRVDMQAR